VVVVVVLVVDVAGGSVTLGLETATGLVVAGAVVPAGLTTTAGGSVAIVVGAGLVILGTVGDGAGTVAMAPCGPGVLSIG
jgi:hypothetical protein